MMNVKCHIIKRITKILQITLSVHTSHLLLKIFLKIHVYLK